MDKLGKAQGTIEYLVILGIIMVIGLVVVSIISGFSSQGSNVSKNTEQLSSISKDIAILDKLVTPDGNYYLNLKNNTSNQIEVYSITLGSKERGYSTILPSSSSIIFPITTKTNISGETQQDILIKYKDIYGFEKTALFQKAKFQLQPTKPNKQMAKEYNYSEGLIGLWHFDEGDGTWLDSSGNSLTGVCTDDCDIDSGKFGKGVNLEWDDGVGAIQIDNRLSNLLNLQYPFSVTLWVYYLGGDNHPNWANFFGKIEVGEQGFGVERIDNSNFLKVKINDEGFDTNLALNIGWNHLVFVYDGVNSILYLNSLKYVGTNFHPHNTNEPLRFGDYSGYKCPDTIIDEGAIWSRALSDEEVKWLYNNGVGRPVPNP